MHYGWLTFFSWSSSSSLLRSVSESFVVRIESARELHFSPPVRTNERRERDKLCSWQTTHNQSNGVKHLLPLSSVRRALLLIIKSSLSLPRLLGRCSNFRHILPVKWFVNISIERRTVSSGGRTTWLQASCVFNFQGTALNMTIISVCCFLLDLSKRKKKATQCPFCFSLGTQPAWPIDQHAFEFSPTLEQESTITSVLMQSVILPCKAVLLVMEPERVHKSLSLFSCWWTFVSFRSCGIESPMLVNRRWVWANIWSVKILVSVWHITVSITVSLRPNGISTSLMSAYRTPHVINAMSSKRMDMCQLDQMWSLSSKVNETDRQTKDNHASVTIKE